MNFRYCPRRFHVLLAVLIPVFFVLATGQRALARQIHCFSVCCDTYQGKSGGINKSVSIDRMMVHSLFKENVNQASWGVTLRYEDVPAAMMTKDAVLARWDEFRKGIAADDTVFVYFSGHGGIEDRSTNEVLLSIPDRSMINRAEWAKSIEALPCKLKIFVTDCCSSFLTQELAEGDEEVLPWNTLYYLLLKHEGFVDITAASPGQYALGSQNGGVLTLNLLSDMQRYRTWDRVFKEASERVHEEITHIHREADIDIESAQRPFAYGLAKPTFVLDAGETPSDEANEFIIAASGQRKLTRAELEGLGLQQLYFARNEIFARHGYDFSTALLKFYFTSRAWYQVRAPGFQSPKLSEVERHNVDLIIEIEKAKGGPFAPGKIALPGQAEGGPVPDVFPYSSTQLLTRSAVEKLGLKELSIARNEIYARYGYPFEAVELQKFFSRKPYYRRNAAATSPAFNAIEKQNLWLIKKLERIKKGPHQW